METLQDAFCINLKAQLRNPEPRKTLATFPGDEAEALLGPMRRKPSSSVLRLSQLKFKSKRHPYYLISKH
jgi:hypothetical protein